MKIVLIAVWGVFSIGLVASAAQRTWIGGNANWDLTTANWTGGDEPDPDDEAIFNTPNSVQLANASEQILGLTLSGGIDLFTNDNDMTVAGLVQLSGSSTNLILDGSASLLAVDDLTINSGGTVQLIDGGLTVNKASGTGLLDINAGGTLSGRGTLNLNELLAAATTLLVNDGALSALSNPLMLFGTPPVGTLAINANTTLARIDLDGASNSGVVNVFRNQTLDINVRLSDAFSGDLNLFHNSTLDISGPWTMDAGTLDVDNGFVNNPLPNPDIPADVAFIRGGAFTQTGGTITVVDTDGTLQFDAPFTMSGGTLTNNGLVVFNANATIGAAANFVMAGTQADLTVEANRTVDILQTNFNMDANGTSSSQITVHSGGQLNVNVSDYDTDAGTNAYDGVITLNAGNIEVNTADAAFVMDGTLNMNNISNIIPVWAGEPLDIGDDAGILDAKLNVGGTGRSNIASQVDFNSDADVNVAAGGVLHFSSSFATVNFNTVNGANNAEFTGAGELQFSSGVNVNEAVTLNMVGGTVDLDGSDGFGDLISIDAPLVINAATMSNFGKVNGGGGVNTLDINNNSGTGVLTVNLDSAASEWTLNAAGVMNLVNDNGEATLLAGSGANLHGTVNVTGGVRLDARVDIGGTVNLTTGLDKLRLADGPTSTLQGGTVLGQGILTIDGGLTGFGTLANSSVVSAQFESLLADDGILTIQSGINVHTLGTADDDGVLNIPQDWSTQVARDRVSMLGGVIQGGTITNDRANGIKGFGTIAARVINESQLEANGGTLIVQTANNDNDWDGLGNNGRLDAPSGTLELRDNAEFSFQGASEINFGRELFTNGFALKWEPASSLRIFPLGLYRSTHATSFGGDLAVINNPGGDPSEIRVVDMFRFESTSSTSIRGTLLLNNPITQIDAGALLASSGLGVLNNVNAGNELRLQDNADIDLTIQNQGILTIGENGPAHASAGAYRQATSGTWHVDLAGTGPADFDRFDLAGLVTSTAELAGTLDVRLLNGFQPAAGDSFEILTASIAVNGQFDTLISPAGLSADKRIEVLYSRTGALGSPATVRLRVLPTGDFDANGNFNCADVDSLVAQIAAGTGTTSFDMNGDGNVNVADLPLWLALAGAANLPSGNSYLLGDANLDGVVDGSDFNIWNSHKFTSLAAWCSGDFSADGVVDGSDFNIWNSHKFTASNSITAVPEPTVWSLFAGVAWALRCLAASRRRLPVTTRGGH